VKTFQRPVFTSPLQNLEGLNEGQTTRLECRLIPVGDPTLKVEWFRNEQPIETSKSFHNQSSTPRPLFFFCFCARNPPSENQLGSISKKEEKKTMELSAVFELFLTRDM
jgi:hypothetical protein